MAGITEIRTRIDSVQQTLKITNAMYLISSSKLRKARQQLAHVQPFYERIRETIADILHRSDEMQHVYFDKREKVAEHKVGYIVISGDKGLAGAYNHNITKMTEEFMANTPGHHKLYVLGVVGRQYFSKKDVDMDGSFRYTVQKPTMHRARMISEEVIRGFLEREVDEVHIIYTQMQNAVVMEPVNMQLLPLKKTSFSPIDIPAEVHQEEIEMFPSADGVLDIMIPNYLTGVIYGCLVEAYASENNARMTAMQSSTDSAKKMLQDLSIQYNRARQAAITQEITEVCSGAKAQKRK